MHATNERLITGSISLNETKHNNGITILTLSLHNSRFNLHYTMVLSADLMAALFVHLLVNRLRRGGGGGGPIATLVRTRVKDNKFSEAV